MLVPFYWVWMGCGLVYVPQFLKYFFYSVDFFFSFIKIFVVVWFYCCVLFFLKFSLSLLGCLPCWSLWLIWLSQLGFAVQNVIIIM